jgi:hypothetical protein
VASRTQIVCLCEGKKGKSIDEIFINKLIRSLKPGWVRQEGSNIVRIISCGGRKALVERMPAELRTCLNAGSDTTLMVWADCDDDCKDGNALKALFQGEAEGHGVTPAQFDRVVFIFAKDRLENWVEFLQTGRTDESQEGPRAGNPDVVNAAKRLASMCREGKPLNNMPPSLQWSCRNWRALVDRMR